jgi:hypothetical protein
MNDLARRFGHTQRDGIVIARGSPQSEIADLAFTMIYTVSRVRMYERRGLLRRTRGRILLLN